MLFPSSPLQNFLKRIEKLVGFEDAVILLFIFKTLKQFIFYVKTLIMESIWMHIHNSFEEQRLKVMDSIYLGVQKHF